MEKFYVAVEVLEVEVEKGFAISLGDDDNQSGWA